MNNQQSKVKDAPEDWIVKYRAAVAAEPMPQTRTSRLLAVLDDTYRTIVSTVARFVDDWIRAQTIPVNAPVQSASVPDAVLSSTLQKRRNTLRAETRVSKKAG
jgi:hypothetical protein